MDIPKIVIEVIFRMDVTSSDVEIIRDVLSEMLDDGRYWTENGELIRDISGE